MPADIFLPGQNARLDKRTGPVVNILRVDAATGRVHVHRHSRYGCITFETSTARLFHC